MIREKARSGLILLSLVIFGFRVQGQCKITASISQICRGNSIDFTTSASAYRYEWKSGNGLTESHPKATFLYDKRGNFKVSLMLYDSLDHLLCKDSLQVSVFDLPVADLDVRDTIYLCRDGVYCFTNRSKPGQDKSPIVQYLWLFGDGDMGSQLNPCHRYNRTGEYMLYLNIRDSNGCESYFQKKLNVKMAPPVVPWFVIDYSSNDSCPVSKVLFKNLSYTPKNQLKNYYWNFGDGTSDSNNLWTNFYHTYTSTGVFKAKLYFESFYGCKDSFTCDSCPKNTHIVFNFNVTKFYDSTCYQYNSVVLSQVYHPEIEYIFWNFGDIPSGSINVRNEWTTRHSYSNPGIYDVRLMAKASKCHWDTLLCNYIKILGPKAEIFPEGKISDSSYMEILNNQTFGRTASKCLNPKMVPLIYNKITKTSPFVSDIVNIYCNAPIAGYTLINDGCRIDTVKTLSPTGSLFIYDSFQVEQDTFMPWDEIPLGTYYKLPTGRNYIYSMHDTDLFSCTLPNYVSFSNTSQKFRLYHALDDNPPYSDGSPGSDRCKNKAWPWASDSMLYFWDFDDSYAKPCTATAAKPDMNCMYSVEKVPWHLYRKEGCYRVILTVKDTMTGCISADTVMITNSHTDAGWDTTKYSYLDYILQQLKSPLVPRRGMSLGGKECILEDQKVNLSEILPKCTPQDWSIVFDSLNDCSWCTDTVYKDTNSDGRVDTFYHTFFKCNWISKETYERFYPFGYPYNLEGCKTVGLRVNNGDCEDTFWYHNYKYISYNDPSFNLVGSSLCSLKNFGLVPAVKKQDDVVSYRFDMVYHSDTIFTDSFTRIADTAYRLCLSSVFHLDSSGKKVYDYCFHYPTFSCPDEPLDRIPLDTLLKQFVITDTFYLLALDDTIRVNNVALKSGIYDIFSRINNIHGCEFTSTYRQGVGFEAFLETENVIACTNDTIQFADSQFSYIGQFMPFRVDWDFNNDGIYELLNKHDPKYAYSSPGTYTVKIRVIDLTCGDTLFIRKDRFIHISGVKAAFDTLNSPYNCAPQVVKFLDSSEVLNPYNYIYDSLGRLVDSVLVDAIGTWEWNFGDNKGQYSQSFKKNPAHPYTNNGYFDVSLVVTTYFGCKDTVKIDDYIKIEGPRPAFILLDTAGCVPYSVRVIDSSEEMTGWIWNPGDKTQVSGVFNKGDTIRFNYTKPGVYFIGLTGTDTVYNYFLKIYHKCISSFPDSSLNPFKVTVYPTDLLDFNGDTLICSGTAATFTDRSDPDFDSVFWDFGDGNHAFDSVNSSVSHIYTLYGDTLQKIFTVLHDGSGARCPGNSGRIDITVKKVISSLEWDSASSDGPYFCFRNLSKGGRQYTWDFGTGDPHLLKVKDTSNRCTNFYDHIGTKTICLTTVNEIGCLDKACIEVENNYDFFIYVPNVFTPGTSIGINDLFKVSSKNIEHYDLKIFNRWGQLVYESDDPSVHWDGIDIQTGEPSSAGTYYYILHYNFRYLKGQIQTGTCTLIR